MFESLPFSRPASRPPLGHAVSSMSVHGVLAVAAVLATRQVVAPVPEDEATIVLPPFVDRPASGAPSRSPADPLPLPAAPAFPTLPSMTIDVPTLAPVDLPVPGPAIDLAGIINRTTVLAPGSGGGNGDADIGDEVYTQALVDEPVELLSAPTPVYPTVLAGAGMAGRVVLEFVVDTTGEVEPGSIRVLEAAHPAFAASARTAIAGARFRPARARDQLVRQRVRQAVRFVAGQE